MMEEEGSWYLPYWLVKVAKTYRVSEKSGDGPEW